MAFEKIFKDKLNAEDYEETCLMANILSIKVPVDCKEKVLKGIGFKEVENLEIKEHSQEYFNFIAEQAGEYVENICAVFKDKKQENIITYVPKQNNHNYAVILWMKYTKNNFLVRLVNKLLHKNNFLNNRSIKILIKGELAPHYQQFFEV